LETCSVCCADSDFALIKITDNNNSEGIDNLVFIVICIDLMFVSRIYVRKDR
jgi:hypothetical protein